MALAPEIRAPEARVIAAVRQSAVGMLATAGRSLAVINFPSDETRATQAHGIVALRQSADIRVTQARALALVKGRTSNPRVRAWTFTLDGHDFYVLHLGDRATLVYDVTSEQWVEWGDGNLAVWRANTGLPWLGAELSAVYGSNIVVGDNTLGLLWFLDPDLPYDESPDPSRPQQAPFSRVVTGQTLASGRAYFPCYAIFLEGDNYGLTSPNFTPEVMLETSDDQGRTFVSHGALTVTVDYDQADPYAWYSLGQISSPGRIFRVTDNGVFTRVDSMEMNDAG